MKKRTKSPVVNNLCQMAVKLSSLISKLMHSHFSPFIKIRSFFDCRRHRTYVTMKRWLKCLERRGNPLHPFNISRAAYCLFHLSWNLYIFINKSICSFIWQFPKFSHPVTSLFGHLFVSLFWGTIQSPCNSCEIKFSSVYRTVLIYG